MSREEPGTQLGRRMMLLLALACGVSVANVYFPQAISPLSPPDCTCHLIPPR